MLSRLENHFSDCFRRLAKETVCTRCAVQILLFWQGPDDDLGSWEIGRPLRWQLRNFVPSSLRAAKVRGEGGVRDQIPHCKLRYKYAP